MVFMLQYTTEFEFNCHEFHKFEFFCQTMIKFSTSFINFASFIVALVSTRRAETKWGDKDESGVKPKYLGKSFKPDWILRFVNTVYINEHFKKANISV